MACPSCETNTWHAYYGRDIQFCYNLLCSIWQGLIEVTGRSRKWEMSITFSLQFGYVFVPVWVQCLDAYKELDSSCSAPNCLQLGTFWHEHLSMSEGPARQPKTRCGGGSTEVCAAASTTRFNTCCQWQSYVLLFWCSEGVAWLSKCHQCRNAHGTWSSRHKAHTGKPWWVLSYVSNVTWKDTILWVGRGRNKKLCNFFVGNILCR
jgi:hypothetical protein